MERACMSDIQLAWRSSLEGVALPAGERFALAEAPAAARIVFRGDEAARARCSAAFGADLPARLGTAGEGGGRAALWLGPDEWLLIAERADPGSLGATLEAELRETPHSLVEVSDRQIGLIVRELRETPHSLVEVSDRQIGLIVRGASASRALSAGCPLDLRLTAFRIGMATRTIFDKVEIVLWRRAAETFRVEVWRSFAPYLVAALGEAARGAP
jgi:sarcosine oxidase subunit gamma